MTGSWIGMGIFMTGLTLTHWGRNVLQGLANKAQAGYVVAQARFRVWFRVWKPRLEKILLVDSIALGALTVVMLGCIIASHYNQWFVGAVGFCALVAGALFAANLLIPGLINRIPVVGKELRKLFAPMYLHALTLLTVGLLHMANPEILSLRMALGITIFLMFCSAFIGYLGLGPGYVYASVLGIISLASFLTIIGTEVWPSMPENWRERHTSLKAVGNAKHRRNLARDAEKASDYRVDGLEARYNESINNDGAQPFQVVGPLNIIVDDYGNRPSKDVEIPKVGDVIWGFEFSIYTEPDAVTSAVGAVPVMNILLPNKEGTKNDPFWVEATKVSALPAGEAKKIMSSQPVEVEAPPRLEVPDGYMEVWRGWVDGWMNTELTVDEVYEKQCVIYPCESTQTRLGKLNPPANSMPQWREKEGAACFLKPQRTEKNKTFRIWINAGGKEMLIMKKS